MLITSKNILPHLLWIQFLLVVKKDKLRPGDVLGALVKEAGLEPNEVGDITILPIITYVAIKKEKVEQAIEKLTNGKIKNRKFRVGLS